MSIEALKINGMEKWLTKINDAIKNRPKVLRKNLISAGLIIQGEAQRLTPVKTGNLKSSAFTIWRGGSSVVQEAEGAKGADVANESIDKLVNKKAQEYALAAAKKMANKDNSVVVGFSAAYAIYVHENLEAKHKTGQAKFLQAAIVNNMHLIILAIAGKQKKVKVGK